VRIIEGDCIEVMRGMDAESVDAIVTDPPYGLGFMGKAWDALPPGLPWAQECLRVLKPGGHLLAFGGTRTYHRLACAVEDAGFEIRDCLAWLYGSGFPKSLDVSKAIDKSAGAEREVVGNNPNRRTGRRLDAASSFRSDRKHALSEPEFITAPATPDAEQWQGWGTALKPAHEPIVMARKPLVGTVAGNVLAHGTGALNVDGCRIEHSGRRSPNAADGTVHRPGGVVEGGWADSPGFDVSQGRWPANVLLDPEAAAMLDEQSGPRIGSASASPGNESGKPASGVPFVGGRITSTYADKGGASRFFYCAKASTRERSAGLDDRNGHPTVKPIELMRWLVRLVTPPAGTVLDPFTGSGTTGCAAVLEGFDFIGIEREAEYAQIARARIAHWSSQERQLDLAA
jgi:DNA modification methylase